MELDSGEIHAVRWDSTGTVITDMGTLGFNSSTSAINTAGKIAGWNDDDGVELMARYDVNAPGFERILDDVMTFSQGYGVNDNDTMVGIYGSRALVVIAR